MGATKAYEFSTKENRLAKYAKALVHRQGLMFPDWEQWRFIVNPGYCFLFFEKRILCSQRK